MDNPKLDNQATPESSARSASLAASDYDQIKQILAADMTTEPSDAALPEPNAPLGPVALAVYGLVQETRQLRGQR